MTKLIHKPMTSEILLAYLNGNLTWARDEFWNSSKLQMRDVMLEATDYFDNVLDLNQFINVIFLP